MAARSPNKRAGCLLSIGAAAGVLAMDWIRDWFRGWCLSWFGLDGDWPLSMFSTKWLLIILAACLLVLTVMLLASAVHAIRNYKDPDDKQ